LIPILKDGLLKLSATAFENLIFDLARAGPLTNLSWRTPGADGGRDIEGQVVERDFSGYTRISRWLIECKRYEGSIGWPVVWEKVAYGDTAQADFLMIASTATFTPKCLDEVEKWNAQGRRPTIRLWPVHELEFRLALNQGIAQKYGLANKDSATASSVAELALHVARMAQAANSYVEMGRSSQRHMFAATCLAELLYIRSDDLARHGTFRQSNFLDDERLPDFVILDPVTTIKVFDRAALRAALACIYLLTKTPFSLQSGGIDTLIATGIYPDQAVDQGADLLRVISFWGNFTIERKGDGLWLTRQILT